MRIACCRLAIEKDRTVCGDHLELRRSRILNSLGSYSSAGVKDNALSNTVARQIERLRTLTREVNTLRGCLR